MDSPVVMLRLEPSRADGEDSAHAGARDARIEQLIDNGRFRDAVCETARIYGPFLHRFFARWSSVEAEDAVQDTLLKVYESLSRGLFDGRGRFAAWLFRVASNLRKERFRKQRRREGLLNDNLAAVEARAVGAASQPLGADKQLELRRAMVRLREAIERLPSKDQDLLALRFAAGLTWQDVAEVLGIRPETAKVRGMRLRRKLAEEVAS